MMDDLDNGSAIWHEAFQRDIILVPFAGQNGIIAAAIRKEDLEEACSRAGLNSNSWDDVFSLGLGFFVETSAPGYGDNREEAYIEALKVFDETPPVVNWKPRDE